jgi:hypothetical protein
MVTMTRKQEQTIELPYLGFRSAFAVVQLLSLGPSYLSLNAVFVEISKKSREFQVEREFVPIIDVALAKLNRTRKVGAGGSEFDIFAGFSVDLLLEVNQQRFEFIPPVH